jgi:hypothetical protein
MSQPKRRPLNETEYLLRSRANARRLLAQSKSLKNQGGLQRGDGDGTRGVRAPQKFAAEDSGRYTSTTCTPSIAVH